MEVYNGRLEKFKNTQSIQWRMNLSIWTLLALAIYKSDIVKTSLHFVFVILILLIICGIHFCQCSLTQKSINADKAVNDNIVVELNKIERENVKVDVTLKGKLSKWSWIWILLQTTITVILSIILAATVCRGQALGSCLVTHHVPLKRAKAQLPMITALNLEIHEQNLKFII